MSVFGWPGLAALTHGTRPFVWAEAQKMMRYFGDSLWCSSIDKLTLMQIANCMATVTKS
jgi:hypothetical protein